MSEEWKTIPFEKSIEKVKYTSKIASSEYLEEGTYPIVSQEEGLISGYWNNSDDVFRLSKPVVIFGDHTRALKYVDFDFVPGADGVRILQPIEQINTKFLLYYLQSCKIPSLGYSRHYKLLKELSVPVPPLSEQESIVAELNCLSGVIEKQKRQLKELDNLAQAIFYDMFGDPISNEKGWEVKKLGDVCDIVGGSTPKRTESVYWENGTYPWFTIEDIRQQGRYITDTQQKITEVAWKKLRVVPENSVLLCCTASIGEYALTKIALTTNQQFNALIIKDRHKVSPEYLMYVSSTFKNILLSMSGKATINFVSAEKIKGIRLTIPPLSLQQEFASKIEAIEKQKELIKQSLLETETLFNSRMDYYFN